MLVEHHFVVGDQAQEEADGGDHLVHHDVQSVGNGDVGKR